MGLSINKVFPALVLVHTCPQIAINARKERTKNMTEYKVRFIIYPPIYKYPENPIRYNIQ